jgi:hypothetical protein
MQGSRKDSSKWMISQEVFMREAESESARKVLDPSSIRSLSDSTDPSIIMDLITTIQRRRGPD